MIAEISGVYGICYTFDVPDGRFRDRLKLDNQTGSLTITNITTEHAGLYEVEITGVKLSTKEFSSKKVSHSVSVYDQGLPLLYIVLISASAGSLLIVAAVVVCCICKKCRKNDREGKCFLLLISK
ncbi:hypothetical protein cypCar_00039873 [Cyprinus carpio]|nr:hypothetical protein cypCar_00039873 [Cyprinus carpio]